MTDEECRKILAALFTEDDSRPKANLLLDTPANRKAIALIERIGAMDEGEIMKTLGVAE